MYMNLDQLQSFLEVAERGHFTQAAQALHLAQPSLSRQIATLERDLGARLFHRVRGRVSLTTAGETLLPYARRMLADADGVRVAFAELAGLTKGRVRLGATPSLCTSIVTDALTTFHERHPGIEIELSERGSRGLATELVEGGLDLALLTSTESAAAATLATTPLLTEELVVASSSAAGTPLAADTVTLAELALLPQIAFHRSYDLRAATEAAFAAAGLVPNIVLEGPEMDAVLRFVERGVGVAVIPAMVAEDRPALRATRLIEPRLTRTVRLARRHDFAPTRAAAALQGIITTTADDFAARRDTVRRV